MKGFKNINGCLENKKNENQSNLDDLSIRFQQKLSVFQKAKEKFNRKFRKILEEVGESKIEKLQLDDSSVLFSMIRSKICVLQPKNTNKYGIKHPTFSFSEINNLNSFINFSNSFEETK